MVMRPVRFNKVRIFALCVAAVIWLPCVPAIYRGRSAGFVSRSGLSTEARALMVHQRALWDDPVMRRREVEPMRRSNPEWDFMGRVRRGNQTRTVGPAVALFAQPVRVRDEGE